MPRQSGLWAGPWTDWKIFSLVSMVFPGSIFFYHFQYMATTHLQLPTLFHKDKKKKQKWQHKTLSSVTTMSILGCSLDLNKMEVTADFKSQYITCT